MGLVANIIRGFENFFTVHAGHTLTTQDPDNVPKDTLFKSGDDASLHYKDADGDDHAVAYVDDLDVAADLASTAAGKGASLVGLQDAPGLYTAAQVENALIEVMKKANAGLAAPMSFRVDLATLANADVVARFTPGVAGKIRKISAFVAVPATTAAKAATLTPYVGGVTVTGGALALTSANCTPKGAKVDGSAITAANAFAATDEITVVVSGVTAFVEGSVQICLFFDPAA